MAGGISLHAVDVARGIPAIGMRVEIARLSPTRKVIAEAVVQPNGTIDHPVVTGAGVIAGPHEALFFVGDFYKGSDMASPFLDQVPFRFVIFDEDLHYHLPIKFTPWGFSLYRGA